MKTILVICTGNTCRSPMAEAWLNARLAAYDWWAKSAGVAAWPGQPASPEAVAAMKELDINLSAHASRPLTEELVHEADILLAMTQGHCHEILRRFPEAANKTFLLDSFGAAPPRDVPDPYGGTLDDYRRTRGALAAALGDFLVWLADRGNLKQ